MLIRAWFLCLYRAWYGSVDAGVLLDQVAHRTPPRSPPPPHPRNGMLAAANTDANSVDDVTGAAAQYEGEVASAVTGTCTSQTSAFHPAHRQRACPKFQLLNILLLVMVQQSTRTSSSQWSLWWTALHRCRWLQTRSWTS
jgi:hypothetical protein